MTQLSNLSRRGFVKALGIATGALVLGAPQELLAGRVVQRVTR